MPRERTPIPTFRSDFSDRETSNCTTERRSTGFEDDGGGIGMRERLAEVCNAEALGRGMRRLRVCFSAVCCALLLVWAGVINWAWVVVWARVTISLVPVHCIFKGIESVASICYTGKGYRFLDYEPQIHLYSSFCAPRP
ncbi:hypothetical protein GOBAR_DD17348 [Gossypium barbadense]|nr:hypothetical protein GOBAR_DD17348 [Gossypium barbadense]